MRESNDWDRAVRMTRHADRQRSDRLAVTPSVRPIPPPDNPLYHKPLTAPADRLAAFTFSIRVAAGSLWRRFNPRSFTALNDSGTSQVASGHAAGGPGPQEVQVVLKEPHARAA